MFIDHNHQDFPDTQIEKALLLQNMLIGVAENGELDESIYLLLRQEFMNGDTKWLLPEIVTTCRDFGSLWGYLKRVASGSGSWEARRFHIYQEFTPLLDYLEGKNRSPSDSVVLEALSSFDAEGIHSVWEKALQRRHKDPDGAITVSRTLLETVCKHILDEASVAYAADDLSKLYGKTAEVLNLAPTQHTEQVFKTILGGCHTVVHNLGTLRNKMGDAHGHGRNPVKPSPRHAALAVNLAGSMATFLIETWNDKNG